MAAMSIEHAGIDHAGRHLSVAMTEQVHKELSAHLGGHLAEGHLQEDLAFGLWRPSTGHTRTTAILEQIIWPEKGDRLLQGNAAFTPDYIQRVLHKAGQNYGIALIHGHFGPGWQGMSRDDVIAEQDRLAGAVAGHTGLPLVGLTWGTDGAWSARFWIRQTPRTYTRRWADTVRVVGQHLRMTYHPLLHPKPSFSAAQVATASVWGEEHQADLARIHVGIIGLGSVGSIVAEALSRVGITRLTLTDHDHIETRNLDRTLGAFAEDATMVTPKVRVAGRLIQASHTGEHITIDPYEGSVLSPEGLSRALDCDVLFSCVDRPAPRHLLNTLAYAHLIPVIDGGILARVDEKGDFVHATWRIHTIGPGRACLVCLNALKREDIALDLAGLLDDPAYIQGLGAQFDPRLARQNVFPFSLSVAAHEVLQMIGLITGDPRIGGEGPQTYHAYPGMMEVALGALCHPECEYAELTATATDLSGHCLERT